MTRIWRFAGISRYDGAVRGGLGRVADIMPGFGPRYDDFCQLMLHLLAEPQSAAWAPDPGLRKSLRGLCIERTGRVVAGASDASSGDQTGGVSSGPHVTS